jgi:hypothetical protein
MSSLTYTAYTSRNLIKYGGIGLIAFLILWSITSGAIIAYKKAHPAYTPPTVKYGMLPKIIFPEKQFEKKNFNFEFPGDATPNFKDQNKVFIVYRPSNSFLALEDDTKTAADFGFVNKPNETKPGVYEFKNETLNRTLTMNVLDGSFKLEYPYLTDQTLLNPGNVPDKAGAIEMAKDFLETGKKYTQDIEEGEKKVSYWKIDNDGLKSAAAQSDANIARIDFYRTNPDTDLKILSSEVGKSSISILLTGATANNKNVVEVNYKYANIDRQSFSTYPIKTAQTAIEELKAGNYWPASDVSTPNVTIRKMYLAYFEPVTLTNYMQPIFVFEGDNNFIAYVPAVNDKYIQE